jgi:hypothetical protein
MCAPAGGLTARIILIAALCAAATAAESHAVGPTVSFITPTDVTPRSFEIVWVSSDPATAALRLFEAPGCLNEIFTADITPFPTVTSNAFIVTAAQQKGVMAVRAAGLIPDTDYCVQTVTTSLFSSLTTTAPVPPLIVRTAKRTARSKAAGPGDPNEIAFSNDLTKIAITRSDPNAPTTGSLVLLKVSGAASPLSAFVGDGVDDDTDPNSPTDLALFDLNNLYGASTGESLDLRGDGTEDLSARALGGPEGFVTVHARVVPTDHGLNEVALPAPCRNAGQTACDGRLGDADADGAIAIADASLLRDVVVGLAPIAPCAVCGDTVWDLTDDMKDALAIAQVVSGLRLLP